MQKAPSIRRTTALELLSRTGMMRDEYAPPAYRLLWRLGVDIPPPHFMSFTKLALFQGITFFIGIAIGMTLIAAVLLPGFPPLLTLVLSLLGGGAFGLVMARHYDFGRRRHGLPLWHDLPTS